MRVERISGKEERQVLTGMIVDPIVCARIASKWVPEGLFASPWANTVGEFCVKYNTKYGAAPNKDIESMFEAWASKGNRDKDVVKMVERFLMSLSDEYDSLAADVNAPHLIDVAGRHFTRVRLQKLTSKVEGMVDLGQVEEAAQTAESFGKLELGEGSSVNVLQDTSALERAFAERSKPLITLRGALGQFFGNSLVREGFISFLAGEKVGKTTWLTFLAWAAMRQRRRVAFFSVGDESEEDMMLRFAVLAAQHPRSPGLYNFPRRISREAEEVVVENDQVEFDIGLTFQRAIKAFRREMKYGVKSKNPYLRLAVHPNSTLTVKDMDAQLDQWEREGYVADVVITDYMDILKESGSGDEYRHRVNQTWKDYRSLTQRRHVLGITATQADADSYTAPLLGKSNFSEDKRKMAHVTGMAGLNQTDEEKERGLMRLNWIVRRGDYFNSRNVVHVAGCMAIGNPAMRSCF